MKKYLIITIILIIILVGTRVVLAITNSVVADGTQWSVRIPTQDFGFYANGRYWVFYQSNSYNKFQYKSSTDNVTWNSATTIYSRGTWYAAMYDIYFDGTYVHYIRNNTVCSPNYCGLKYRRGIPESDGSITWSASEQTVLTDTYHGDDISLAVDSNGYPWIGMQYSTVPNYTKYGNSYVTKSSTNDGTWSTAFGYPKLLRDDPEDVFLTKLVPLTNGKMYAISYVTHGYWGDSPYVYPMYGRLYNGSTWGDEEQITTSLVMNYYADGVAGTGFFNQWDAISIGDDIHLTFVAYDTEDIRYIKYSSGSWSAEEIIVTTDDINPARSSPTLTNWGDSGIYMFWVKKPNILYLINDGGTWTETPQIFLTDQNIVADQEASMQAYDEPYGGYGGIFYLSNVDNVYKQNFVSYTVADAPEPPAPGTPDAISRVVFKNNVIFNGSASTTVIIK